MTRALCADLPVLRTVLLSWKSVGTIKTSEILNQRNLGLRVPDSFKDTQVAKPTAVLPTPVLAGLLPPTLALFVVLVANQQAFRLLQRCTAAYQQRWVPPDKP